MVWAITRNSSRTPWSCPDDRMRTASMATPATAHRVPGRDRPERDQLKAAEVALLVEAAREVGDLDVVAAVRIGGAVVGGRQRWPTNSGVSCRAVTVLVATVVQVFGAGRRLADADVDGAVGALARRVVLDVGRGRAERSARRRSRRRSPASSGRRWSRPRRRSLPRRRRTDRAGTACPGRGPRPAADVAGARPLKVMVSPAL